MTARTRWPLLVIGAAAGTSTWSGWVGLGQLTGFGVIHPLPGIADGVALNTAITLPIGVEAYAVYALAVATGAAALTNRARRYAWMSAAGALGLGMLGQIAYHVMAAAGVTAAPWQVVALVSCLPVLVLGAASLLWHLAGETAPEPAVAAIKQIPDMEAAPVSVIEEIPEPAGPLEEPTQAPVTVKPPAAERAAVATDEQLAEVIAGVLGENPKAGRPTVVAALKARNLTPGKGERIANAIAAHKRGGIHAVPTSAAL